MKAIKLKSAFALNIYIILYFIGIGFLVSSTLAFIIAGIFCLMLPICSTTK